MDFLRRHAFYIICTIAGGGGIALAVTGLLAMPDVNDELEKAKRVYDQLNSLQSNAVNQERIEAEANRIELTREDRNKVFAKCKELYGYEPLVEGAFPDGSDDARRRFRREYEKAMGVLFESLLAGTTATSSEIRLMKEKIENEKALEDEGGVNLGTPEMLGDPRTPAGVLTMAGARRDATARANIAVAQKTICYGVHFGGAVATRAVSSLEFDPMMRDIGTMDAPTPAEAWRAQVGYWIQKDVVDAIVAVNRQAGDEAVRNHLPVWVGVMPVKNIISIRVSDYIVQDEDAYAGAPAGSESEALPSGTANTVFTHSITGDTVDVIQFTVKLVMDQRDIPRFVDELSKNRFHTLLRVAFKAISPNRDMHGKIYGSGPTVNVVMDFEAHLLAEVFRRMMPEEVCENYDEIDCDPYRELDETEEDEES